jgi:hypothetical protein
MNAEPEIQIEPAIAPKNSISADKELGSTPAAAATLLNVKLPSARDVVSCSATAKAAALSPPPSDLEIHRMNLTVVTSASSFRLLELESKAV